MIFELKILLILPKFLVIKCMNGSIKILCLGENQMEKNLILNLLCGKEPTKFKSCGCEIFTMKVPISIKGYYNVECKVEFWNIIGGRELMAYQSLYVRDPEQFGALLYFIDLKNMKTLNFISTWFEKLSAKLQKIRGVFIGCKYDKSTERNLQISKEFLEKYFRCQSGRYIIPIGNLIKDLDPGILILKNFIKELCTLEAAKFNVIFYMQSQLDPREFMIYLEHNNGPKALIKRIRSEIEGFSYFNKTKDKIE